MSVAALLATALPLTSCGPIRSISVTSTTDGAAGSLRRAIDEANTQTEGETQIELPSGTYALTQCAPVQEDGNASGDLDLDSKAAITLIAKGPNVIIRQTCAGERVLEQRGAGVLKVSGIRIEGGTLVGAGVAQGGGVRVEHDLVLERSVITNNSATATTPASLGVARGGGLYAGGSLVSRDSEISANMATGIESAEGGGAWVRASVEFSGGAFTNNRAAGLVGARASARGGGLAQESVGATMHLSSTTFTGNVAEGSIEQGGTNGGGHAGGGAISTVAPLVGDALTMLNNQAIGNASG